MGRPTGPRRAGQWTWTIGTSGYRSVVMQYVQCRRLRTSAFSLTGIGPLLSWMNGPLVEWESEQRERLTLLIGRLQEALSRLPHIGKMRSGEELEAWNHLCAEIDAEFRRHTMTPRLVGFSLPAGRQSGAFARGRIQWETQIDGWEWDEPGKAGRPLQAILELVRLGLIERLRRCANAPCNQWLYASYKRQRFCSQACREKSFRSTDEGRRKRREYMRLYRADLKRRSETFLRLSRPPHRAPRRK